MQETVLLLRQQLNSLSNKSSRNSKKNSDAGAIPSKTCSEELVEKNNEERKGFGPCEENYVDENTPTSVMSLSRVFSPEGCKESNSDLKSQVHVQVTTFSLFFGIICNVESKYNFVLTNHLLEY